MDIYILRPATPIQLIGEDIVVEVDEGQKRPATHALAIGEQELMLKGYVYIGIRPDTIPLTTKGTMVDFRIHQYLYIV